LLLGSCKAQKSNISFSSLNGNWEIVELNGASLTDKKPTLTFNVSDKKVSAYAGCNRLAGTVTPDTKSPASLKIGTVISTKMFCANAMDTEHTLAKALEAVETFDTVKESCIFYGANKQKLFVIKKIK
jgi:heat shock protein HslJ